MNTHSTTSNEGWIEWNGGECPVAPGTRVNTRWSDGDPGTETTSYRAGSFRWKHFKAGPNLIAYRIVEQGK